MSTNYESAIQEVREWTTFRLANEAGVGVPDAPDSAGAQMLDTVRVATLEALEYEGDNFDPDNFEVADIADTAPSVYTHERWQQFVDLAAYNEDMNDLAPSGTDSMTELAGVALYIIAERLANTIVDYLRDNAEESDDEDDEL